MLKEKIFLENKLGVNLSSVKAMFCQDDAVIDFFRIKNEELNDRDKWIEENKGLLETHQDKIAQAVKAGLIKDGKLETIYEFKLARLKESQEKALAIKHDLETNFEQIKAAVAQRLDKFCPAWIVEEATISFEMNEQADFCVDTTNITADLYILTFSDNPREEVIAGLSHELFHIWFKEGYHWSDSEIDERNAIEIKKRVAFRTTDEGLAVYVSGQNLSKHHTDQGRVYPEYTDESFQVFDEFLKEDERDAIIQFNDQEFKNMGHFYVVGNELAKQQLDGLEGEELRKKIEAIRTEVQIDPLQYIERCREQRAP